MFTVSLRFYLKQVSKLFFIVYAMGTCMQLALQLTIIFIIN